MTHPCPWKIALVLASLAGAAGAQSVLFDLFGTPGSGFGATVDTLGDLDGDGFGEFLVGSPFEDNVNLEVGAVRVYSGKDGSLRYTLRGSGAQGHFGTAAGPAGDVNADG